MKDGFKIEGMEKVQRELKNLEKRIKSIGGKKEVGIEELLTDSFIRKNSNFDSLQKMVDSFPKKFNSGEDFKSKEWNEFVKLKSNFDSWEDMLHAAHEEWVKKELNL